MTFETNYLIDFSDILALEFECKNDKCKAKFTLALEDGKRFLECPICNSDWLDTQTREEEAVRLLIASLRDSTEMLKGRAFSIRLKIAVPSKQ